MQPPQPAGGYHYACAICGAERRSQLQSLSSMPAHKRIGDPSGPDCPGTGTQPVPRGFRYG